MDNEPPESWWGACPFCGKEGKLTLNSDRVCNRCGFEFNISGWEDE